MTYPHAMTFNDFIDQYLDGQGAVVEGASVVATHFPQQMSAPTDVTKLMRESFGPAQAPGPKPPALK